MALTMSQQEREAFLGGLHVGVISIEDPGAPPISVPIWYDYSADIGVWILTEEYSLKGRALAAAGRFALCAQTEEPPNYRYVSVSGPIVSVRDADKEADSRPMAHRYFGAELGDLYTDSGESGSVKIFTMRPERWRTVDYGKLSESSEA